MRQRAAICRALIHDPTLLLMDEPFSALDAMTRDEMGLELLRIWQANRKSVLFVTHSIREAAFLSDRVLVMGRRPASMIAEMRIDTPRPRRPEMMEPPDFNAYVRELRTETRAPRPSARARMTPIQKGLLLVALSAPGILRLFGLRPSCTVRKCFL
jgi:NitT/TauT family transport system ATP-binding protein